MQTYFFDAKVKLMNFHSHSGKLDTRAVMKLQQLLHTIQDSARRLDETNTLILNATQIPEYDKDVAMTVIPYCLTMTIRGGILLVDDCQFVDRVVELVEKAYGILPVEAYDFKVALVGPYAPAQIVVGR